MVRVVRVLLLSLAVIIGLASPSSASSPGSVPSAMASYTHDSHHSLPVLTHTAGERGPPATYDRPITCCVVDARSHGASASPNGSTSRDTYDYDRTALLVQVNNVRGTTRGPVQANGGDPLSLRRSHVAANSGSRALNWSRATINEGGVSAVGRHLSRFESGAGETAMLVRLRAISRGELDPTDYDLRFYTHELRESVLYRKAGYPSGQPTSSDAAYDLWDRLHTQALTDYGLTRSGAPMDLFHPSVRP